MHCKLSCLNSHPLDVTALRLPLTATRGLRFLSPPHAGSTELKKKKPISASNPAPGQKTNWVAGRKFFLHAGTSSSLLYLKDSLSNRNFLVDSEISVSVFPAPASSSCSRIRLVTANRYTMTCSGSSIIPLQFGSKRFHWTFQLA